MSSVASSMHRREGCMIFRPRNPVITVALMQALFRNLRQSLLIIETVSRCGSSASAAGFGEIIRQSAIRHLAICSTIARGDF